MNKKKMKKLQEENAKLRAELNTLNQLRKDRENELGYIEGNKTRVKRDLNKIGKKIDKIYEKLNRLNGESGCCVAPY